MQRKERQVQGLILQLLKEVIEENKLDDHFEPYILQEESFGDIWIRNKKGVSLAFVELKDPIARDGRTVYNRQLIQREYERAKKTHVNIFCICNLRECALYDISRPLNEREYIVSESILNLSEIHRLKTALRPEGNIKRKLKSFLLKLLNYIKALLEKKLTVRPIDERLIAKIRSFIEGYVESTADSVWESYTNDRDFKKAVRDWSKQQSWTIPTTREDITRITRIALLVLITRLVFYKVLYDEKTYGRLPIMTIPEHAVSSPELYDYLWDFYFGYVEKEIDFETILGDKKDLISQLPFQSNLIVDFIRDFIDLAEDYNFKKLPYDVIGRIFECLINEEERHKLGQYFTPSFVVDLINCFCLRTGHERVLDPSCGSGTFLVRAYFRKRKLTNKKHPELLKEIYGIDISPYAVHLASSNMAIRDLRYKAYPRVILGDFFEIGYRAKEKVMGPDGNPEKVEFSNFDVVIGNPPYTRQEEMDDFYPGLKEKAWELARKEWNVKVSKRSSIFAYFFYHGAKLLKESGYFGYITSNSWLDVDYGKNLQKWMLDHFKIITIIDSKVERFFPDADVNTAITILQRCSCQEERDSNIVKFVYLKQPLYKLIDYFGSEEKLRDFIENTKNFFEDDYLKIKPVVQRELFHDDQWGKYLRAPAVFWKILERGRGKLVRLGDVAEVKRGFTTGANEFFYLKDKTEQLRDEDLIVVRNNIDGLETIKEVEEYGLRIVENGLGELWLIEKEFLEPVIKSAREIKKYEVNKKDLKYKVLFILKFEDDIENLEKELRTKYPRVWEYIKDGERKGYHTKPTCRSRKPWYSLGNEIIGDIVMNERIGEKCAFYWNKGININKNLYAIYIKQQKYKKIAWGLLNSTIIRLFIETSVRSLTGAITAIDIDVCIAENIDMPNPENIKNPHKIINAVEKLKDNVVLSIFKELNANTPQEVDLSKVNPDRLALDKAVLKAIGFKDDEIGDVLVELYKSVIDLVKSRLEKAGSVERTTKKRETIKTEVYVEELEEVLNEENIKPLNTYSFYQKLVKKVENITSDKKLQKKILNAYWQKTFGEDLNPKQLEEKRQMRLF